MKNKAPEIDQYLDGDPSSFAIWMLAQCDFGPPLTNEGWEKFMEALGAACREKGEPKGKLFLQVFNHDPDFTGSEADPEQRPWVGLEFDYALTGDEVVVDSFSQFYTPRSDISGPAFDPDLVDHAYVIIPYGDLNLESAEEFLDDIPFISGTVQ